MIVLNTAINKYVETTQVHTTPYEDNAITDFT